LWAQPRGNDTDVILAAKGKQVSILARTDQALAVSREVILGVPSHTMRGNIKIISPFLSSGVMVVSAADGLEISTKMRMSQVITEEISPHFIHNIGVISGPNLARQIQ
jgi:glycerol-3-phosphate dehydrogenase (NAD(P)+)